MNKLIYKGKEYELVKIDNPKFQMSGDKAYDMEHRVLNSHLALKTYEYDSLKIDGQYYGFYLINKPKDESIRK